MQVLHSAVLALRRVGLDTGVVIDIGLGEPLRPRERPASGLHSSKSGSKSLWAGTTRATPVLGGKVVEEAVQCQCFGAANITNMLLVRLPSRALLYISRSQYSVTAREALIALLLWVAEPSHGLQGHTAPRRLCRQWL